MRLLEYQAKKVLNNQGIPIPEGVLAYTPEQAAKACEQLGRIAVKAQVPVGGRGKAGGVKVVERPEDAYQAASKILGLEIGGFKTSVVYCEKALTIAKEVYVSCTVDRDNRCNVIMLSSEGGIDIEEVARTKPEAIFILRPDPFAGPHDFELRNLIFSAQLGQHVSQLVSVLKALYSVLTGLDAVIAEINPLVITSAGEVIAGDAKVEIDDNAIYRQPWTKEYEQLFYTDPLEVEAKKRGLTYVSLNGYIGIIGNGAGLCMGTLDLVKRYGGEPANFCDIGGGARAEVVKNALQLITMNPSIKAILINVFGGITRCDEVARGLVESTRELNLSVPIVVRLTGTNAEQGRAILEQNGIVPSESPIEAAKQVVELARRA
jgi:succinyl-CoA synthetase beta subunit